MSHFDDNGGWGSGPDSFPARNTLSIYRPEDPRAQHYVRAVTGATHEGRLFLHDICTGQRVSYTARHVNVLLTNDDNPEGIKERIVELIPHLSDQQKQWLADGISDAALEVVGRIDADAAELLHARKQASEPRLIAAAASRSR